MGQNVKTQKGFKVTIRTKLMGGFLIVTAFLIVVLGIGYSGLNLVSNTSHNIYQNSDENYLWQQWKAVIERETVYYLAFLPTQEQSYLASAQAELEQVQAIQSALSKVVPPERQALFETITAQAAECNNLCKAAVDARVAYDNEGFNTNMAAWEKTDDVMIQNIELAVASSKQSTLDALTASDNTRNNSTLLMIIIGAAAVLFAIGIALLISQAISKNIKKVSQALKKMATGDLSERVNIRSSDETGEMALAYNETQKNLNSLVIQLKENAVQLTTASNQLAMAAKQSGEATQQVASSSGQMAKGAQEQSNNAQETTKSVNQLSEVIAQLASSASEQSTGVQKAVASITSVSQTMSQVADNANQAAQGARLATESANDGAAKTRLTLAGIEKISQASGITAKKIEELGARSAEIGKIVAVIDDIASQTNLLALNAAIEAARAGEQGRGFAVVSDEVRKLAERSASATKEIAELIGSIQKGIDEAHQVMIGGSAAVTEGCDLAKQAGLALDQILKVNSKVNAQVEQISAKAQQVNAATGDLVKVIDSVGSITEKNAAATEQMSRHAVQVSKSVETVAGIAEENSAATEQVSASAEEMSAQIHEIVASSQTVKDMALSLEKRVAMFKIDAGDNHKSAPVKQATVTAGKTTSQ